MTGDLLLCDTDGCGARLALTADVDESQAAPIAQLHGWLVRQGRLRDYHFCPKHKEAT